MRAIIVDDVQKVAESLQQLIVEFCEGVEVVGIANNAEKAKELIEKKNPDIVFLDIQMPRQSGFDLLESMEQIKFSTIFVTAFNEYAIKALRFGAIDYLLKPVDIEELKEAILHTKQKKEEKQIEIQNLLHNLRQPNDEFNTIVINAESGVTLLKIDDIIRIEADGNYSIIYSEGGRRCVSSKNLKNFELFLEKNNFIRVHHSHLINIKKIKKLNWNANSELILSNGEAIPVSVRKRNILLDKFPKF